MSLRRLYGWEPVESREYEYDDQGRLVRVVIVREPEWSVEQVDYLLASREIEMEPKNSLGTPLSVLMAAENQFRFTAPQGPSTDWQEAALGRAQDLYYEANKNVPRHGHHWRAPDLRRG